MTVLLASGLVLAGCSSSEIGPDAAQGRTTTAGPASPTPSTTRGAAPTAVEPHGTTVPSSLAIGGGGECPKSLAEGTSRRLEGDLDGDGRLDTIAADRPPIGETVIQVCRHPLDIVPFHVGDTNKPAEVYLIDVEGDGATELLVGGPTGAARFAGSVVRLDGTELTDLGLSLTVHPGGRTGSSFGCVDVDDDGLRELVSFVYEFDAPREAATSVAWTRSVVLDESGKLGGTTSGVFDMSTQPNEVAALVNGTCGDETIIAVS